ncbi:MAG: sulfite exporter TauE/SafE family protein [Lachnospirales bacterium]
MTYFEQLLIICPVIFFAGFVDSIAGGGGLISLPTYIAVGIPSKMALGTNKFANCFGTFTSTIKFIKSGKVDLKVGIVVALCALIGSFIGASFAQIFSDNILRYFMLVFLPIAFLVVLKSGSFKDERPELLENKKRLFLLTSIIGVVFGFYDGFFGPGTGTFIMLSFNYIVGFDIVTSNGNAKMANLASNVAAVISFGLNGYIIYKIAVPAMFFAILGNFIGSRLAIKNGSKIIRPTLLFVFLILLIKIAYDIFSM